MQSKIKSIRLRLFLTLTITIAIIVIILIVINNMILERFYMYSKQNALIDGFEQINNDYNNELDEKTIMSDLIRIENNNNFEIFIVNEENETIYISNSKFMPTYMETVIKRAFLNNESEIYSTDKVVINKSRDSSTGYNFIYLTSVLDNGYKLYMRVAITAIKESVKISNRFLQIMGILTIIISGIMVKIISRRFTDPILQLNKIADQMSKLDFNVKYISSNSNDEIDHLGKSINQMSDTMEKTIKQLRNTNIELEKDIEKKSKTDEMRKQFISDVSHELKTPIALIQGYAEGLVENVANDDESRKFYAEVILDETNKMDILVKRLLELIKIEYGEMEFVNSEFDITELISEIIRKHHVVLNEKNIEIKYDKNKKIFVVADEFYIEQIVNNYFTNAIKNVKEVNGRKEIKIDVTKMEDTVRVSVYNSGSKIKEEDLNRIWRRFFKSDESRNRDDGGTGIGLSIVKALMKQMNRNYGVTNTEEGVEFFFEI
jgi:signal transduction histidine kinase